MSDEKKLPKRRFKQFLNTPSWEQRKLGEIAEIVRGASPRPIADPKWFDNKSDIGWLRISDVTSQDGRIKSLEQSISKLGQEKTRVLMTPHLLLSIAATVGKPVINYVPTGVHDGFLIFMNPKFNIIFAFWWLEMFREKWNRYGQPGSQVNLNSELVKNQEISLPSDEEQIAISSFFENIDNLITLHQRKLNKLEKLKKAYLEELFPDGNQCKPKRRFKEFKDDWEQRKLGDMGETFTGLTGKTKEDFGHGEARYITYLNVFQNTMSDLTMVDSVEIDKTQNEVCYGDILFTTSSETPEEVGLTSVWLGTDDNTYLNSFCFGYRLSVEVDLYFMGYLLRSPSVREQMKILAQGISRYNISKNKVMEIEVYIPTKVEQTMIGQFLHQLDNSITLHQRKLEKLKKLKTAYLEELFV